MTYGYNGMLFSHKKKPVADVHRMNVFHRCGTQKKTTGRGLCHESIHESLCTCASEMTQQVKVLATNPDDLSLVSHGTHMVEGDYQLLQVVL